MRLPIPPSRRREPAIITDFAFRSKSSTPPNKAKRKLFTAHRLHGPLPGRAGNGILQLHVRIGQLRREQQLALAIGLRIHLAAAKAELAAAAVEVGRRDFGEVINLAALAHQQLRTVPVQQDLRLPHAARGGDAALVDEEAADVVLSQRLPLGMCRQAGRSQCSDQQQGQAADRGK